MIVLGYISALFIGLVLGLLGGGGSILAVPTLVYLFGIPASRATMYSLFIVGITSAAGTFRYLQARLVNLRIGALFLIPSLLGVALSRRWILPQVPDVVLELNRFLLTKDRLILLAFALVMGLASYSMLRKPKGRAPAAGQNTVFIPLFGLFAGCIVGFVGAGGGFLIIPVLVGVGKMEMKPAVGTSLLIIALSSLFGFAGDWRQTSSLDWRFLLSFTGLSICGVMVGMRLSRHVSSAGLKRAFGLMVLGVAILILINEILFQ